MKCLWWLWKCGDSSFIFIYCHFYILSFSPAILFTNQTLWEHWNRHWIMWFGWMTSTIINICFYTHCKWRSRARSPPAQQSTGMKIVKHTTKKKLAEIESKWTNKRSIEKYVICWKSTKQRINNKRISQWKKKKCMQSFDTNETIIDSVVQITCILKSHLHSRSAYSHAYHRLMVDWMGATKMYTLQTPFISIEQLTM